MENNYYVPDISEFHVGFECERSKIKLVEEEWESCIVEPSLWSSNAMWSYIVKGEQSFRVKYLDKEDIESLGFVYKGTRTYHIRNNREISGFSRNLGDGSFCHITCFMNEEGLLDSHYIGIEITDIFEDDDSSPFGGYREGGSEGLFGNIIIKNKSELKVLLKQLGVMDIIITNKVVVNENNDLENKIEIIDE